MSLFADAITSTGYVRVAMVDIISALKTLWQTAFGADVDVDPRAADGQIIGGVAEMFSDIEGVAADTYNGIANPNGATGQFLTNIMGLNGLQRNPGMASYMPVAFTGTPSTAIATGSIIQSTLPDGTTAKWSSIYTLTGGVQTPGAVIGGGGSSANAWAVCTVNGATKCYAGTPLAMLSVISGVTGVSVVSNATTGYVSEGDPSGRARRQNSFSLATQGMVDGLDSALNNMPADVSQAAVWENNTGVVQTFAGGGQLNPKSIRAIVAIVAMQSGGNAQHVVDKIYRLKAPGCGMQGAQTGTSLDEQGNAHPVFYDVAAPVRVFVGISLATRAGWPSDGAQQIANLIGAWSANPQNHPLGGDSAGELSWTAVLGSFLGLVPGFDLITASTYGATPIFGMVLGTLTPPEATVIWNTGSQNLPLSFLQYASIAATDVVINGTLAFPTS